MPQSGPLPFLFLPNEIDILANADTGELWFFYGKPIGKQFFCAAYESTLNRIFLLDLDGRMYDLGVPGTDNIIPALKTARTVYLSRTHNRQIVAAQMLFFNQDKFPPFQAFEPLRPKREPSLPTDGAEGAEPPQS